MTSNIKRVDHNNLKTNQTFIISLSLSAYIFDVKWLVVFLTSILIVGGLFEKPGFAFVNRIILYPMGWLKPNIIPDSPDPHLFAQTFGAAVLALSAISLYIDFIIIGWALLGMVVLLASLNLFFGFCLGCSIYYWLHKNEEKKFELKNSGKD